MHPDGRERKLGHFPWSEAKIKDEGYIYLSRMTKPMIFQWFVYNWLWLNWSIANFWAVFLVFQNPQKPPLLPRRSFSALCLLLGVGRLSAVQNVPAVTIKGIHGAVQMPLLGIGTWQPLVALLMASLKAGVGWMFLESRGTTTAWPKLRWLQRLNWATGATKPVERWASLWPQNLVVADGFCEETNGFRVHNRSPHFFGFSTLITCEKLRRQARGYSLQLWESDRGGRGGLSDFVIWKIAESLHHWTWLMTWWLYHRHR